MLPKTRGGRTFLGAAAVVLACALTVLSARGLVKGDSSEAPDYRRKGDPAAPIVIVEYSDYECPACSRAEKPLQDLLDLYGKDVRFVFKNYPLRQHHWAKQAAASAECAGRQGKFWPYHDELYKKQAQWTQAKDPPGLFTGYAKDAGLDLAAFAACQADPAVMAMIEAEVLEGNNRWVGSTPTFFINRRRFVGSLQLASLGTLWIDKQLKAKR